MVSTEISALPIGILDGRLLSDEALARLAVGGTELTAFSSSPADRTLLAERWARIAPGRPFHDGGVVANVREAITECARRQIIVLACPPPAKPAEFVGLCLQGAASTSQFDVPAVAVHVMRDTEQPGSVAWLSDTGELSGYGILFAVGYATLHATEVELIEPAHGLARPRTPEVVEQAMEGASSLGIAVTRHSDPSPIARVLRDPHCLVVHPILDAPTGFNLLHPGHLPHKAVAKGSPAVVVELLEKFPGDVVAVFDSVRLIQGPMPAGRMAAAAALGVIAAAGIGTIAASPAMAAPSHSSSHIPAGNHYGWCKNPNNPHFNGEDCGPQPTDWVDPGVVQVTHPDVTDPGQVPPGTGGPDVPGPTDVPPPVVVTPTQTPDPQVPTPTDVPPPVVVTGTVDTVTGFGPVTGPQVPTPVEVPPPLVPPLPNPGGGGGQPPAQGPTVQAPIDTPTLVPPVVVTGTINTVTGYGPVGGGQVPTPTDVPPQAVTVTTPTPVIDVPAAGGNQGSTTQTTDSGGPGTGSTTQTVETGGQTVVDPGQVGGGDSVKPTSDTTDHRTDTPAAHPFDHTLTTPSTVPHVVTIPSPTDGPAELAHTGGNTAILAIVAGSLLAAGAGLAVAGRVAGKSDTEGAVET